MEKRIAIVLGVVLAVGAVANASELWNNGVAYNGNWSEPNWAHSAGGMGNHPGGTVDTRISGNCTVTLDVTGAQAGPLFVGRTTAGSSGQLDISDPNASLLVSKASTELMSVGYDGTGIVNQSAGLVKVATSDLSSELRISHAATVQGTYNLSVGLLDVEKLSRGGATYPGVFNATGGTLIVRTKIFKFGLASASLGFAQGGALLEPGGIDAVGTITSGDSGNKQTYTAGATSVLEFDIASDSSYDKVVSYGNFALDSCTIRINLLGDFTPGPDSFFDIFTTVGGDPTYGGTGTPTIETEGFSYCWRDVSGDGVVDTLRIPEPATLSVLAFGGLAVLVRRRRA